MDILETLKADYQRFPVNQTYSIYAKDVYFQDAVFKFRGLELYKWMIKFIQTFFLNLKMDLHNIQQQENTIKPSGHLAGMLHYPGNQGYLFLVGVNSVSIMKV